MLGHRRYRVGFGLRRLGADECGPWRRLQEFDAEERASNRVDLVAKYPPVFGAEQDIHMLLLRGATLSGFYLIYGLSSVKPRQ